MKTLLSGVVVALLLSTASFAAAADAFRITVNAANVRKEPSYSASVITTVKKDARLTVIDGSDQWIKVEVIDPNGSRTTGYVLNSLGILERTVEVVRQSSTPREVPPPPAAAPTVSAPAPAIREASVALSAASAASPAPTRSLTAQPASQRPPAQPDPASGQPDVRTLGLGGRAGGFTFGIGASARYWSPERFGFQIDFSRYSIGDSESFGGIAASAKLSTWQIAPSILYAFGSSDDHENFWIRPYVGGGINIFRSSMAAEAFGFGESISESSSETNLGGQGFAGAQFVFKSLPRMAFSGDLGYYSTATPFSGVQLGGFAMTFSAHFFVH